jgi:YggT family protein
LGAVLASSGWRGYTLFRFAPMGPDPMHAIIALLLMIIKLYTYVVLAAVIMSWLLAFNVVNMQNQFVRQVHYVLAQLTEPLLRPIRQFMPDLGGIDISPIVLLLALWFIGNLIANDLSPVLL